MRFCQCQMFQPIVFSKNCTLIIFVQLLVHFFKSRTNSCHTLENHWFETFLPYRLHRNVKSYTFSVWTCAIFALWADLLIFALLFRMHHFLSKVLYSMRVQVIWSASSALLELAKFACYIEHEYSLICIYRVRYCKHLQVTSPFSMDVFDCMAHFATYHKNHVSIFNRNSKTIIDWIRDLFVDG